MEAKNAQIEEIRHCFDQILDDLLKTAEQGKRIDQAERQVFTGLLSLGLLLVKYYLSLLAQSASYQATVDTMLEKGYRSKGLFKGAYWSVFGKISFRKSRYFKENDSTGISPLDEVAGFPEGIYSYVLDDWLGAFSAEINFPQACGLLERILGHSFGPMVAQRDTEALSEQVQTYYDECKPWPDLPEEGAVLCAGFDGKGVPMVLQEREGERDSPAVRLGKGQKKGVKKEATLSVSFSIERRVRSPQEVVDALFRQPPDKKPEPLQRSAWSKNKHMRAFLSARQSAIKYGLDNLLKRDTSQSKSIIILTDGDWKLIDDIEATIVAKGLQDRVIARILDIIHLLEYVWKVANAVWGEKHPGREKWVKEQLLLLLESRTEEVIAQWIDLWEADERTNAQKETIDKALTYLNNHREMVDYKSYLAQGLPISTGIVESACGHLVKTRMEQNGMRWSYKGAQAVLDTRAVLKNSDWDDFMEFFIHKEQRRIYPNSPLLRMRA